MVDNLRRYRGKCNVHRETWSLKEIFIMLKLIDLCFLSYLCMQLLPSTNNIECDPDSNNRARSFLHTQVTTWSDSLLQHQTPTIIVIQQQYPWCLSLLLYYSVMALPINFPSPPWNWPAAHITSCYSLEDQCPQPLPLRYINQENQIPSLCNACPSNAYNSLEPYHHQTHPHSHSKKDL